MKKLVLFALLVSLAGYTQAQQATVKSPAATDSKVLLPNAAPVPTILEQFLPLREAATGGAVRNTGSVLRKTQNRDLFEIGLMANTYGMIGDTRNQVACDPKTNTVAVIFRGNDRGTSDGNTLYIRYSSDHGATWTSQGDNIANSPEPRYPNIFLPNNGSGANTSVLWSNVVQFGDGSSGLGSNYAMKADIGNTNPSYSQFEMPPNWLIPWQIRMDQTTGDLYTLAPALEPSNGEDTGEIYVFRSQDKGASWSVVSWDQPAWDTSLDTPNYFERDLRLDISPNGTMVVAWAFIAELVETPGSALIVGPDHGMQWRTSTDGGLTWSSVQTLFPKDINPKPVPFNSRLAMTWDFDVILDADDKPHFLTVCSAGINPISPYDDAPTDSTILLNYVDSTFATEITIDDQDNWHLVPIGPVRRVFTRRTSLTELTSDESGLPFRNEPSWARSYDGSKIYAKWITPFRSLVAQGGVAYVDTIFQVYVNGRLVANAPSNPGWAYDWDFTNPENNTFAMDSTMRMTSLEEIAAKYTKLAYYAGDNGQMHIVFVEWGIGETPDDEPILSDNVVHYIQGIEVPTLPASVEQLDATPGDFALAQNYPNPFNPGTEITFTLPSAAQVSLRVFNLLGQEVATLVNEYRGAGTHRATFDAENLPSGMYIYRLESGAQSVSRKMMLSK